MLLAAEATASLVIAYTYDAFSGFYTFTALFLATVVLTALNNRDTLDTSMNVSAGRIGSWLAFLLGTAVLTMVLVNSAGFPFDGSLVLSLTTMLYVYWTHYSLEPQRA